MGGVILFDMHREFYFLKGEINVDMTIVSMILRYVCPAGIKLSCCKTTRDCFCVNLYMIEY